MDDEQTRAANARWADAGQLMAVFATDPRYKDMTGAELWFKIMPALSAGQYAIARANRKLADNETELPAPVAAILWARVDDATHRSFLSATTAPRLNLWEWSSGENFWIMDSPGDPRVAGKLLDQLHRDRFRGRPFAAFMNKGDGTITPRQFGV